MLDFFQQCEPLDQATKKRNFIDLQKQNCALDTQTRIASIDSCFCREIEKSFCAGKVYLITSYLDNTRLQ